MEPTRQRQRRRLLAAGITLAAAIAAVMVGLAGRPHHAAAPPAPEAATTAAAPSTAPTTLAPGANPQVGVVYSFRWYVHCTRDFLDLGGRSWKADQPAQPYPGDRPLADGSVTDDGYLAGTVELLGPTTLRFDASPAAVLKPYRVTFTAVTKPAAEQGVCA